LSTTSGTSFRGRKAQPGIRKRLAISLDSGLRAKGSPAMPAIDKPCTGKSGLMANQGLLETKKPLVSGDKRPGFEAVANLRVA